jgi:uncharacterized protein GlcG (DUF336 family)
MTQEADLTLAEARALIDRALAKARELKQAGAFAVLDAGGNVVSISRMGEASPASAWVSRGKAYVAAVQRAPSARNAANWRENPIIFSAFQRLMHDEIFPGPGAMPIRKNGRVVGGISTGGGLGPWTEIPGVDPSLLMADGKPANAEDLIISYALQIAYQNQHDDRKLPGPRWEERIDDLPHCLSVARAYADRVLQAADKRGARAAVAVVDELGQLMQLDRMEGSTLHGAELAEAKAMTALNFQRSTIDLAKNFSPERFAEIKTLVHYKAFAGAGGVPIVRDGQVVGAVGVHGGGGPEASDELARAALAV